MLEEDITITQWRELQEIEQKSQFGAFCFFTPKAFNNEDEYHQNWSLKDIFIVYQNGIKTDRDDLFYDFDRGELEKRIQKFYSDEGINSPFKDIYKIEDSSSYDLLSRRIKTSFDSKNIQKCIYRPYDYRWLYYTPGLTSRPAWTVMQHMLAGSNSCIVTGRQGQVVGGSEWNLITVGKNPADTNLFYRGGIQYFPLYLYPDTKQPVLFADDISSDAPGGRRFNFSPTFIEDFSTKLTMRFIPDGKGDLQQTFGPEDIFSYMYAIFHAPSYRERYTEFLKTDFPRLPLTSNADFFRELCWLGDRLVELHLMEKSGKTTTKYPVSGNDVVEKIDYISPSDAPEQSRVWINKTQYIEGVPPEVWDFHIGGYQVCQKWLKDRKGRKLEFNDIKHYQRIVAGLDETIQLMEQIDVVIDEHGGWPIR